MYNDYCGNQNLKASQDLLVHGLCIFKHKFPIETINFLSLQFK